jgi:hypothetical protein
MGLRAILWEFESSRKLILAGAYMGETGDYRSDKKLDNGENVINNKESVFAGEAVLFAKKESSRLPFESLKNTIDCLRASALCRQDLLNIDARRLWLGHWSEGFAIDSIVFYCIPPIEFRADVPTPSRRYASETAIQDFRDWVDVEDVVTVGGKKIPLVRYPYADELDAPCHFEKEFRWADSEEKFLLKAGLPIMLRFFGKCEMADPSGKLIDSKGVEIPYRLYRDGDPRTCISDRTSTILIIPERELENEKKHTVTMTCTLDGIPFERTWSFTTRAKQARR